MFREKNMATPHVITISRTTTIMGSAMKVDKDDKNM
jgi:hypothetical protein